MNKLNRYYYEYSYEYRPDAARRCFDYCWAENITQAKQAAFKSLSEDELLDKLKRTLIWVKPD